MYVYVGDTHTHNPLFQLSMTSVKNLPYHVSLGLSLYVREGRGGERGRVGCVPVRECVCVYVTHTCPVLSKWLTNQLKK